LLSAGESEGNSVEITNYVASLMPHAEIDIYGSSGAWGKDGFEADARPRLERIQRFVGLEPVQSGMDSILSTVLFTDIVGSTEKQAAMGDLGWRDLVHRHHAIVREQLERWRGVENDTAGDGFYATFEGPARAIRCALDVVKGVSELGLEIRAGVHTGECQLIDGKVGGIAVTTGSRISALGGPSQVLVSQTVKDLVAGSGFIFEDAGKHELKGVPDRWQLFRVVK
jgi:class 3 adenylate cyclase